MVFQVVEIVRVSQQKIGEGESSETRLAICAEIEGSAGHIRLSVVLIARLVLDPEVKAVAKWSGAKPEDVPAGMALYRFPTLGEQASKWLGGGKDSTAAKALAATAAFQLSQKQVEKTLPDYSVAVNPTYVQDASK